MASKNSFSIDDILNQYSTDENPDAVTDSEKEKSSPKIIKTDGRKDISNTDSDKSETNDKKTIIHDISVSVSEKIAAEENKSSENISPAENTNDTENTENPEEQKSSLHNTRNNFSYRSATRIQDKPNKIVKNPEDNIRYVRKENDTPKSTTDNVRMARKKKPSASPETKSDISALDNPAEKIQFTENLKNIGNKISEFKNKIFGAKSVSEKNQDINVKAIPDVDFFSIDIEINDETDDDQNEGFLDRLGHNFSNSVESNLDDYDSPGDASLIQNDLYDLKNNLTVKFFIQAVAALASIYLSASALYNVPLPEFLRNTSSPHTYSFAMFLISAIVLFSSFPVITGGIRNLFRKKADCDSLAAAAITFSTIAAAISTESSELIQSGSIYIYTPVAILAFLANTIGKHLIVNRAINNFDMLISSYEKHALIYVDNEARAEQLTKGVINDYPILTATRKTGFSNDFLRYTYSADIADKLCRKIVPASLIISALFTVIAVITCRTTVNTFNISFITAAYSMFLTACTCFGIPIVVNLPLASAAAEAEDNESLILGYQSIDDFYDTNSLILDAKQIFPDHTVKLCAIKMFSDNKIDDAIVAAASLVKKSGSIFYGMFNKIIDGNESLLEKVENHSYEDSMGLCGWIKNKRVLFGNRQHMVNHNIEGIPPKSKEQDLVGKGRIPLYLSISGNLSAIFIVKMKADPDITESLAEISENGISLIIKTIDSVVTVTRISRLYDIPEDMIKIIPSEHHDFCDKITSPVSDSSSSVICSNTLSSIAKVMSNIKYIHHSALTGLVLQSTSAIIALFFVLIFMCIGIMNQITPLMLILYHIIWTLITILIMKVKPR